MLEAEDGTGLDSADLLSHESSRSESEFEECNPALDPWDPATSAASAVAAAAAKVDIIGSSLDAVFAITRRQQQRA